VLSNLADLPLTEKQNTTVLVDLSCRITEISRHTGASERRPVVSA
jgi:hypothetical protein